MMASSMLSLFESLNPLSLGRCDDLKTRRDVLAYLEEDLGIGTMEEESRADQMQDQNDLLEVNENGGEGNDDNVEDERRKEEKRKGKQKATQDDEGVLGIVNEEPEKSSKVSLWKFWVNTGSI